MDKHFMFRFDASPRIGTGHLRRCLCLAQILKNGGAHIHAVANLSPSTLARFGDGIVDRWSEAEPARDAIQLVETARGAGACAIILDRWEMNEEYQRVILDGGIPWLQFHSSPDQPLWADWIVAASPSLRREAYEARRQRPQTQFLLGPDYAIVRTEFHPHRDRSRNFESVERIVMSFGGGDDCGAILAALEAWRALGMRPECVVLTTSANPRVAAIRQWVAVHGEGKVVLRVDCGDFPRQLADADLAILAGGTTLFEAAYLGVPAITLRIAANQYDNALAWQSLGASRDAGSIDGFDAGELSATLAALLSDSALRREMSRTAMRAVDGGGARRLADLLSARECAAGR